MTAFAIPYEDEIQRIIDNALREDVGPGDFSSMACISPQTQGRAKLLVKDTGLIAGVAFARKVFETVDPNLHMEVLIPDGQAVKHGDEVFHVQGASLSILKAERLVLNTMQRMSAIATKTHHFVQILAGTGTQILDTRKTTPGFRACEKWAVWIGGGQNHRFGLYDMVMLKDNHVDFCGGVTAAIRKTKAFLAERQLDLRIVVEARNLDEVNEILAEGGVFRILLDNFTYEQTRQAVALINGRCDTESSGNINELTLRHYAECGVTHISSGALTHSISNLDLSLKAF